ncbi:hypothetical protein PPERSA_04217 [Pseudocohnilembus persalinus]|uniref:Dynein light chain 1, cytoplasmic n=1 Tax=Pseudocohnilembus persalinus TaxID=266149 RepID=A0A0V0QNK3_PSEPJ|nr:hypothetical protein PPERSA_04217 [Pseudocohnilembus persalinus]|eukprot:KRX03665.1 hypothetical protein PPERSA_04217 [Pseudocohnilembus persalinus]
MSQTQKKEIKELVQSKYKIIIKETDMSDDLIKDAAKIVSECVDRYFNEQDIAEHIKKEFDRRHLDPWHVIVGKNFSTYVTYEEGTFVQLQKGITDHFIKLQPKFGCFEINLPLNSNFLHTSYFRMTFEDEENSVHIKKFCELSWECLMILKENFPSKIDLYQENLENIFNIRNSISPQELLRRQNNCLFNKIYSQETLKFDEIEDIYATFDFAQQEQNYNVTKTCLQLLNSQQVSQNLLLQIDQNQVQIMEKFLDKNFEKNQILESQLYDSFLESQAQAENFLEQIYYANQNLKHDSQQNYQKNSRNANISFQNTTIQQQNNLNINHNTDKQLVHNASMHTEKENYSLQKNQNGQNKIHQNQANYDSINDREQQEILLNDFDFEQKLYQLIEEGILNISQNLLQMDKQYKNDQQQFLLYSIEILNQRIQVNKDNELLIIGQTLSSVLEILDNYLGLKDDCGENDLMAYGVDIKIFYSSIKTLVVKQQKFLQLSQKQQFNQEVNITVQN